MGTTPAEFRLRSKTRQPAAFVVADTLHPCTPPPHQLALRTAATHVSSVATQSHDAYRAIQTSSTYTSGSDERTVGVMVVDDQAPFRRAARAVINATPGFAALGEVASGPEALESAHELQPDLVLMDVNMPGMDGFEATRQLNAAHPNSIVVLVSIEHVDDHLPGSVSSCGAVAFLHKQELRPATLRAFWNLYGPSG